MALVFVVVIVALSGWSFREAVGRTFSSRNFRTNIAWISGDQLRLVSIDKDQMVIFNVPETMMMPVVGMKGDLKSGVLRKFAQSEKQSLEIVRRSTALLFGSVVDGVIESEKDDQKPVEKIKTDLISWMVTSDINSIRRFLLFMSVNKLLANQIKEVDIPLAIGVIEQLPDGSSVVNVDKSRFNLVVNDLLSNDNLRGDMARITVENGTGMDNMGNLSERMIKSAGGFVVEVKTGEVHDGWCKFGVDKKTISENSALIDWLKGEFDCVNDPKMISENANEVKVSVGRGFGQAYSR